MRIRGEPFPSIILYYSDSVGCGVIVGFMFFFFLEGRMGTNLLAISFEKGWERRNKLEDSIQNMLHYNF